MRSRGLSPRPNTSIGTRLVENGSPWQPSDGEEDDHWRGGRRWRGQMVAGVELWFGEYQGTMMELAVLLDSPEEDRVWWSMTTHTKEDGGAVNGGPRHRWPATWATTGCNGMGTVVALNGEPSGGRFGNEQSEGGGVVWS
jgi:hypothetical protein